MDDAVTDSSEPVVPDSRVPRAAAPRSVKRSLASIVLGFETIVIILAALVVFGLGTLPWALALGGGVALCLALVAVIGLLRFKWAYLIGWILQVIIVATGFLNPVMFFVGALFAAMWTYCMISGTRIDHQKEIA